MHYDLEYYSVIKPAYLMIRIIESGISNERNSRLGEVPLY